MTTQPYLSLGMMLGDAHLDVLARCLRSVLDRPTGPLVDEVVIGWNGREHVKLAEVLHAVGYSYEGRQGFDVGKCGTQRPLVLHPFPVPVGWAYTDPRAPVTRPPLTLVAFDWPGRFDDARNTYWSHLRGEWLMWLDADDVVASVDDPEGLKAIEAVERDYGIVVEQQPTGTKKTTLKDLLRTLPPQVNTILAPYDYIIAANGTTEVRQSMKRLVRRELQAKWYSPQESGIHETLMPFGALKEQAITTFGLLVRHFPTEAEAQRAERNRTIVQKMVNVVAEAPDGLANAEPRALYDLGNARLSTGDANGADAALRAAIAAAQNDADRRIYRLARASLRGLVNDAEGMLQEALAAVGLQPELPEAYYVAAEAFFRLQKWAGCVEFFERGREKKAALVTIDQPMARWSPPRMQAAMAHLKMGNPERGVPLVHEVWERDPGRFANEGREVIEAAVAKAMREKLYDVIEWLAGPTGSTRLARELLDGIPNTANLRELQFTMRHRVLDAKVPREGWWAEEKANGGAGLDAITGLGGPEPLDLLSVFDWADTHRRVIDSATRRADGGYDLKHHTAKGRSIAFYCPAAAYHWSPCDVDTKGLGGSEGSVAYLARELSRLGHRVRVYTVEDKREAWNGVEQLGLQRFERDDSDVVIACRTPWAPRELAKQLDGRPCYVWHQDNGYANPWMWSKETEKLAAGQLHVSRWAADGLMREIGLKEPAGHDHYIIGNGILPECTTNWDKVPRNPLRIIYASDPTRGLGTLLDAWPRVLDAFPEAELVVACDFRVMLAINQSEPGVPVLRAVQRLQERMARAPRLNYVGWIPHATLIELCKSASVYAYPGGPMPEGFGVSLVQAQACGCTVVAPEQGALPEVLSRDNVVWLAEGHPADVAFAIKHALREPNEADVRTRVAEAVLARHGWPAVAARFLKAIGEE